MARSRRSLGEGLARRGGGNRRTSSAWTATGRRVPGNAREIAERLRGFLLGKHKTIYEYADKSPFEAKSVYRWVNRARPVVPDPAQLVDLATHTGISLDWLLLGEGPEIRGLEQTKADLGKSLRTYLLASLRPTRKGKSRTFLERAVPEGDALLTYVTQLIDSRVAEAERASHESARLLLYRAVAEQLGRATSAGERTRLRALFDPAMVELFQAARTDDTAPPGGEPTEAEAPEAQPERPIALSRPEYPREAPQSFGPLVLNTEPGKRRVRSPPKRAK